MSFNIEANCWSGSKSVIVDELTPRSAGRCAVEEADDGENGWHFGSSWELWRNPDDDIGWVWLSYISFALVESRLLLLGENGPLIDSTRLASASPPPLPPTPPPKRERTSRLLERAFTKSEEDAFVGSSRNSSGRRLQMELVGDSNDEDEEESERWMGGKSFMLPSGWQKLGNTPLFSDCVPVLSHASAVKEFSARDMHTVDLV